ncbi:hypothetical protein LTR62_001372 [Meristemomyces frigidus]|uniref:Uncharacterized protein n=1 Tax=Meristemomyces frigidus TaxID=1508187 RepID=A0AAN7TJR9_9PEZI|nr:hypothetical protein LTR62_001372 [Meristemomyces frigidus]
MELQSLYVYSCIFDEDRPMNPATYDLVIRQHLIAHHGNTLEKFAVRRLPSHDKSSKARGWRAPTGIHAMIALRRLSVHAHTFFQDQALGRLAGRCSLPSTLGYLIIDNEDDIVDGLNEAIDNTLVNMLTEGLLPNLHTIHIHVDESAPLPGSPTDNPPQPDPTTLTFPLLRARATALDNFDLRFDPGTNREFGCVNVLCYHPAHSGLPYLVKDRRLESYDEAVGHVGSWGRELPSFKGTWHEGRSAS